MNHRINIAIDGPSASGKGTISQNLAKKLDYIYIDTGSMYRCMALKVINLGIDPSDETKVNKIAEEISIQLFSDGSITLDGVNVSARIRENDIPLVTSKISAYPAVRKVMVKFQRSFIQNKGCIMDGRDIGSVVMPDAELKIYLSASADVRAERRYLELVRNYPNIKYEDIYNDLVTRDYQDTHRIESPLVKTKDAIEVDTSEMSIDQVVEKVYYLALERMN